MDWRELKIGKVYIMLMGGDVHGDWKIDFFPLYDMICLDNEQLWKGMGRL